jgi:hypothetical protein
MLSKFTPTRYLAVSTIIALTSLAQLPVTVAQESEIVSDVSTGEGIVGDIEKHRRAPVILSSTVSGTDVVKILVDSYVPNEEMRPYPIQFDFFINRQLFASQIRSVQQPGAIGVDIGTDVAVPPFDYTVIARVLHPSRTFTSVLTGTVAKSEAQNFASCTVEVDDQSFAASPVEGSISSEGALNLTFNGSNGTSTREITVTGSVVGTTFAGTVKVSGVLDATPVNGTVVSGERSPLDDLSAEGSGVTVSCK